MQVCIGLHTGDLIEAGNDFFGTFVNKAARVAATACPDEIRVSDATRVMVGNTPEFAVSDAISAQLNGIEGEHLLYRLDWRA